MKAFLDSQKWWIYRTETGTWDVSAPSRRYGLPEYYEFPTGAEALAAFAAGGVK